MKYGIASILKECHLLHTLCSIWTYHLLLHTLFSIWTYHHICRSITIISGVEVQSNEAKVQTRIVTNFEAFYSGHVYFRLSSCLGVCIASHSEVIHNPVDQSQIIHTVWELVTRRLRAIVLMYVKSVHNGKVFFLGGVNLNMSHTCIFPTNYYSYTK